MDTIHDQEKRQFKRLFEDEGIDRTADRLAIMEVFLRIERHITFQELYVRVYEFAALLRDFAGPRSGELFQRANPLTYLDPDYFKEKIYQFVERFGIDVIILENASSNVVPSGPEDATRMVPP